METWLSGLQLSSPENASDSSSSSTWLSMPGIVRRGNPDTSNLVSQIYALDFRANDTAFARID
jgi:hypothetical protein